MKQYLYIAFGCLVIAAWALFLLLSGCAPSPRFDACEEVKDRAYKEETYTCLHKSEDYCSCLREQGHISRVIVGPVDWVERDHAWVEVEKDGEVYWCEPTWLWGCWEAGLWTDRKEN